MPVISKCSFIKSRLQKTTKCFAFGDANIDPTPLFWYNYFMHDRDSQILIYAWFSCSLKCSSEGNKRIAHAAVIRPIHFLPRISNGNNFLDTNFSFHKTFSASATPSFGTSTPGRTPYIIQIFSVQKHQITHFPIHIILDFTPFMKMTMGKHYASNFEKQCQLETICELRLASAHYKKFCNGAAEPR